MKKQGGLLKIFGIVFVVFIIILLGVGIYFYNFHVFKSVRICVGDANDVGALCTSDSDCLEFFGGLDASSIDAPSFVQEKFQALLIPEKRRRKIWVC